MLFLNTFSQGTLLSRPGRSICESDDLQKFKELTLGDLKVIGIVGKVLIFRPHLGKSERQLAFTDCWLTVGQLSAD